MSSTPRTSVTPAAEFTDGLGVRTIIAEKNGEALELLRVVQDFALVPAFETALRERVGRLANFRHAYYSRVRRVDRLEGGEGLGIVSERPVGARLSQVLAVAERFGIDLDINAALCLVRQLVPAVAMLHENAREVSHGAIAPERILVTAQARIVITDYVLGSAIEHLNLSRERLWRDLQVAVPPGAGHPRFNQRVDIMQIGMVALALVLGRRLRRDDVKSLADLIGTATETTVLGRNEPISPSLRKWLLRALQLDGRGAFETAAEAQQALDDVLSGEGGYVAAPIALETFLGRYQECAGDAAASDDAGDDADAGEPARVDDPPRAASAHPAARAAAGADTHPPQRPPRITLPEPPPRTPFTPPAAPPTQPARPVAAAPVPSRSQREVGPLAESVAPSGRPATPAPRAIAAATAPPISEPLGEQPLPPEPAVPMSHAAPSRWRRVEHIALAVCFLAAAGQAAFIWTRYASAIVFPQGTLTVDTRPAGVQVLVDGAPRGATPLKLELSEGAHVLELRAGGEPRVLPITIAAGTAHAQYVEMPNALVTGSLLVRSDPTGARVLVDGQYRGTTPATVSDLAAGSHELVVEGRGGRLRQTVQVQPGATATIHVPLSSGGAAASFVAPLPATGMTGSGTVTVKAPYEMQVFEGSRLLGTTSIESFELAPGRHELEVVSETLAFRAVLPVEIRSGQRSTLQVQLPRGTLQVTSDPPADVYLDGARVGQSPLTLPVAIGPHEVVFRHPDYAEQLHAISVTAASPVRLNVTLAK